MKSLVVASPSSGSGKTTVTMGMLKWLTEQGRTVQAFKVGPDYIDPAYHEQITGRPSVNLDPWMTSDRQVREAFEYYGADADVCVVEGVMGLFDGKLGASGATSTAHVSRLLDVPVLLVVDVSDVARTAAAEVLGVEQFDKKLRLGGVVLNRVAGERHEQQIRRAIEQRCSTPVLGTIPHDDRISVPERQLGLTSVYEDGLAADGLQRISDYVQDRIDLDAFPDPGSVDRTEETNESRISEPCLKRVGVARDAVFCFYYEENLRLLRDAGAEMVPFSPLNDDRLPPDLDVLYLGGGFPEEFAGKLAGNGELISDVSTFQGPILAECGGLIYLCETFRTRDGTCHEMVGEIPGNIQMTDSLTGFGYREATLKRDALLGASGAKLRGHLFHYSEWTDRPPARRTIFETNDEELGYFNGRIQASFFHVHLGSRPRAAQHLLEVNL